MKFRLPLSAPRLPDHLVGDRDSCEVTDGEVNVGRPLPGASAVTPLTKSRYVSSICRALAGRLLQVLLASRARVHR